MWINVEERLPETIHSYSSYTGDYSDPVLAVVEAIVNGKIEYVVANYDSWGDWYYEYNGMAITGKILAWQPIKKFHNK